MTAPADRPATTAQEIVAANAALDVALFAAAEAVPADRLHTVPRGEQWSPAHLMAHLGEFPDFFAAELGRWQADRSVEVGRTHEHPQRLAALDEEGVRRAALPELLARIRSARAALARALASLTDDHLAATTHNVKHGDEPLAAFLDRYVVGHKAGHLEQLRAMCAAAQPRPTQELALALAEPRTDTVDVGYDEFCGALAAKDLQPLWTQAAKLMPAQPIPATMAWLWKWRTVLPLAEAAGRLIDIERGGDRRVLAFANPGLHGLPYTSSTLWGAFQYLGPHETAPAHRHTPAALRFVVEGDGVWTTVDGDACDMSAGDLILTPSGCWHDHTNGSDRPMVWFDGLDLPLVGTLEAVFFENHPDRVQPVSGPHNRSERLHGARGVQPLTAVPTPARSPLLVYRWADTDAALAALLTAGTGRVASLRYVNPGTGGPVMPTLGCEMHRILPGGLSTPHRKVGSSIYVVYRGHGHTLINGQRFDWEPGDVFVTPSWSTVQHQATEPADLFAVTDRPVLEALRLYREDFPAAVPVTSTFEPK